MTVESGANVSRVSLGMSRRTLNVVEPIESEEAWEEAKVFDGLLGTHKDTQKETNKTNAIPCMTSTNTYHYPHLP